MSERTHGTDAEINARLAEAMGITLIDGRRSGDLRDPAWDPLNDIRHAMEVDAMMADKHLLTLSLDRQCLEIGHPGAWCAGYDNPDGDIVSQNCCAPTPSAAICLAALAALEEA